MSLVLVPVLRLLAAVQPSGRTPRDHARGASLVEYALLMALIALVCFAAMQFFGSSLSGRYKGVASSLV